MIDIPSRTDNKQAKWQRAVLRQSLSPYSRGGRTRLSCPAIQRSSTERRAHKTAPSRNTGRCEVSAR